MPQPKKKSPSNQKKKSLLFQKQKEKGFVECDDSEGNNENAYFIQTKDFVTTEKDIEEIVGQEIIRRAKKRDSDKVRFIVKLQFFNMFEMFIHYCTTSNIVKY